jgi:hypothetical protein
MMSDEVKSFVGGTLAIITLLIILTLGIFGLNVAYANYHVWSETKVGEAELARAESNRQIKVYEAKAFEESAKHLASAEIIRSQGVARANEIIGESLRNNEVYLKYRWIEGLQTNQMQVVYVPTECNLPILEAGKGPQR